MNRIAALIWIALIAALSGCATPRPTYMLEANRLTIHINLPRAETVLLGSSLDGFRLRQAHRVDKGTWAIQLPADRTFTYFFIVDGNIYQPDCLLTEADDFGSRNCLFLPGL